MASRYLLVGISLCWLACEPPAEQAEDPLANRYIVELSAKFEHTIFNTQTYDLSPRDERPQIIEPYQLGWLEVISTTSSKPPGWQLSLEQVQAQGLAYSDVHPAIVAYPGRVQKVIRRMSLPGYVCVRWRGLPSVEYEYLSIAVNSSCRPVPAELADVSFDEAKGLLPPTTEIVVLDDPFVIDVAAVRSAFAAEGASNLDGWDEVYVGPDGTTGSYY